ncbi:MAG TPA: response regulator [Nevskiaceae bacterium]|nr:response regulator [Nevskiaceae bacterium]
MDAFAPHRVLVVDDNRDVANSVAALLRLLGHTVLPVYDGATAIALAPEFDPDVAIVDLNMPGIDGFTLAKQLRGSRPAMKIVALTALPEAHVERRAEHTIFDLRLFKPATAQDLMTALAF